MATWLTTHLTQEELDLIITQVRGLSSSFKYLVKSDITSNSPGDWARIVANANAFVAAPAAERWQVAPTQTTAIKSPDNSDDAFQPHVGLKLRDAAFVYLVKKRAEALGTPISTTFSTAQYFTAVKDELLWQASEPSTDFSNTTRWATGVLGDTSPAFWHALWLTRLFFAWEYIAAYGDLSSGNNTTLKTWHTNAATYFQVRNNDTRFNNLFVDRVNGNYTLAKYALDRNLYTKRSVTYYGGNVIPGLATWWNNRTGAAAQYYGLVGVRTGNASMITGAKTYAKEFLTYSTFPNGTLAELERWTDTSPEQGWQYAMTALDQMLMLADVMARKGDKELYQFSTSGGEYGTQGGTKTLKGCADRMLSFLDGTFIKYETEDSSRVGNVNYRLDGNDPLNNRSYVFDSWMSQYNLYWQDSNIKSIYTRTKSGTLPYPTTPAGAGKYLPWSGGFNVLPAKLLLYGKKEGLVDPFTQSKTPQSILFADIPSKTFGDDPITLSATASSGLAITFSLVSGPATLVGSTLTITGAGTIQLKASQAGNGTYGAAPDVVTSFIVKKAKQTLTFPAIPDKQLTVSPSFSLSATASSGLPVDYEIQQGSVSGTLSSDTFSLQSVGTVTILATQPGNDNYEAISLSRTFTILAAPAPVVTNILAGKTYTSSEYTEAIPDGSLTDGLENNTSGVTEFYATWDNTSLGSSKTVTKVCVKMQTPIPNFKVQHYTGSAWVDLVNVAENTLKLREFVIPTIVVTQIRFAGVGKTWKRNLNELEVYGY